MPNWLNRLRGPAERKAVPQSLMTLTGGGEASWSRRGFVSLASEGFVRNPVVHRCVRMIAEAANAVPLAVEEGGRRLAEHPALSLLRRPIRASQAASCWRRSTLTCRWRGTLISKRR